MKNNVQKKKMKLWVKLTIIFSSIIVGFGVILGSAIGYFRLPVGDYYGASEKAFKIPEISDGYVPQGMCYDEFYESFILSGYMKDGSVSPLYLVDKEGNEHKKVTLLNPDGTDYVGHGGGVDVWQDNIYLTDSDNHAIYVYSLLELIDAEENAKLNCKGELPLKVSEEDYLEPAFVTVTGNKLIIGEFYREESYPTPESHKITTKAGDYNQALAIEYNLDLAYPLGVDTTPVKAYSLPDQVQGLEVYEGKIYLSTSWGLSFSYIYEYDQTSLQEQTEKVTLLGNELTVYAMDTASLTNTYKIAPMSEEMAFVDGKLYVNCESASDKYIFGKFTGGKWIYKTDLSKLNSDK